MIDWFKFEISILQRLHYQGKMLCIDSEIRKRVKIPWENWETVEISPEGIHTYKGIINPKELDLLQWKAAFYDRGLKTRHLFPDSVEFK
jgi:hypothetical protein